MDHIKRTHDYEPFFNQYVHYLQEGGILDALLDTRKAAKKSQTNGNATAKKPKLMDMDMDVDEPPSEDEEEPESYADDEYKPKPSSSRKKS